MSMVRGSVLVTITAGLIACASPWPPDPTELMEADRAFAGAVVQGG